MRLTPREEELVDIIVEELSIEQRKSLQAAAYTLYQQLTPNNKKPITPREFHNAFKDNWIAFAHIEEEYKEK